MGILVEKKNLCAGQKFYRPIVYVHGSEMQIASAVSVNKPLAEELLRIKPDHRTIQLEKSFLRVLNSLPELPTISGMDVMFNPAYEVDVMKVLISAYKQKPFSLLWPGRYENGKLIYSAEEYPDYAVFEVSDYDIVCVI